MTIRSAFAGALLAVVFVAAGASRVRAQQTDVIRGRVIGPDSAPVPGADVRATSYRGGVEKHTTTDRSGRYTIIFVNGEGDYWIEVTKIGLLPRRFEIRRIGDEDVLVANVRFGTTVTALGPVDVTARRDRVLPSRSGNNADIGGGDRAVTTDVVNPDQAGNLAAMAASVAGIQLIPGLDGASDVYSMLGLSGQQNNTTFDGLGSAVNALPPEILATTSIRPYPFDPAVGGFSGAQVAIQSLPGSNFSRRLLATVDIAPALQWADRRAAAQGQEYTNARIGGNAAGPIVPDRAFYNFAYNVGRQFSDVRTLLNTNPIGLTAAGVAPDSAARLAAILHGQQIPTEAGGPSTRGRSFAQAAGNVDFTPSASGTGGSLTLAGAAAYQSTSPVSPGGLLLSTPAHAGNATVWGTNLALTHSNYFGFGILSKTTIGLAAGVNEVSPYASVPDANVLVNSTLPDGSASVKRLQFGGGSTRSSQLTRTLQLNNQLSWYSEDNVHTFKLTLGAMHDAFRNEDSPGLLGTFAYNSLAELEAGRPASFTRTLGASKQSGAQLSGFASLSDSWRPTDNLQVQYGARVDGNRFLTLPKGNADLRAALGLDNTDLPSRFYVSPRVGLQWYYGNAPTVAYAPGAARPPRAVIHAGVGVFQNISGAQLIAPALVATGLPNALRSITCVGAATPIPDWSAYLADTSAIPRECADGMSGGLAATAPNVRLFSSNFREPRSLRGAADWSGPILDNRFVFGVQGIVSSGLDQDALVDANLDPTPRFTLTGDGGRPVFVPVDAIVPATGAVSIVGSRVTPAFNHVWTQQANRKLESKQITLDLKPVTANRRLRWNLQYSLLDMRETFSGFTSTAGNPFELHGGRELLPGRHTVTLSWNDFPLFDLVYVSAGMRFVSGMPFTPMVASDVNGDGIANDRAFIFDPAAAADPATANAMRGLLARTSASVRSCLERQLGTLAERGSCQSPWTASGGLVVKFNPLKIGLPKRAILTLTLQNPFALADLALHGSDDLRGWGQIIPPDQNLLFVRGFDQTNRRFVYEVNQRFGSTRPQQSATYALPFVSFGLSVDIGVPRERQLLTRRLDVGRRQPGAMATAGALKAFGTSTIPNPMFLILEQADSLGLTRGQADSLATLSRAFARFADSVWTPAGRRLANLPERYDSGDAYDTYVEARVRTVDFLRTLAPRAKELLTPAQRRRLPREVENFLDERVLKFLRSSTVGDGSSVAIR